MHERQYINPTQRAPKDYNEAMIVSSAKRALFISAQLPTDDNHQLVGKDDFKKQAEQVFANLQQILITAGISTIDVIKINYYLVNASAENLALLKKIRDEFFLGFKPAMTLLVVSGFGVEGALFAVDAIAELP